MMRTMLATMLQALIDAEATEKIGAGRYDRSEDHTTSRNGTATRRSRRRAGNLTVKIPKLRSGSFFPSLLAAQDTLAEHQVQAAVAAQTGCPTCGKPRRHKDTRTIVVRSLLGVLRLPSPPAPSGPRAAVLPERTASVAGLPAGPLRRVGLLRPVRHVAGELLPLGRTLQPTVVRRRTSHRTSTP